MATGRRAPRPRRLVDVPETAIYEAEPCPVTRAAMLTALARERGSLPKSHAAVRRAALIEALRNGHVTGPVELARRVVLSHARIGQITRAGATS